MHSISVATLRTWLTEGRQVELLDVSPPEAWTEGAIPVSQHLEAYEALKVRDPTALVGLALPRDRPVVTICAAGKTASQVAAEQLAAQGFQAFFLEGGLDAWRAAGYTTQQDPGSSLAHSADVRAAPGGLRVAGRDPGRGPGR
jgi:rhodanese-related sulfurtransferase